MKYNTTKDIEVPKKLVDQIIGQDHALKMIKKAAKQRRNIFLIGDPGTGKSLLSQALAELLPKEKLVDILSLPNEADENNPLIRIVPKGEGKKLTTKLKMQSSNSSRAQNIFLFALIILATLSPWWVRKQYGDIMGAASLIGSMLLVGIIILFFNLSKRFTVQKLKVPKLLIDNEKQEKAPFIEATGAKAGALLGDVLHDPLQSFFTTTKLKQNNKEISISNVVEQTLKKHEKEIITENDYQAAHTSKKEAIIFTEEKGEPKLSEILSVNKRVHEGNIFKITTESGKEVLVTIDHKVAVKSLLNKIKYVEAQKLKPWHKLITLE